VCSSDLLMLRVVTVLGDLVSFCYGFVGKEGSILTSFRT